MQILTRDPEKTHIPLKGCGKKKKKSQNHRKKPHKFRPRAVGKNMIFVNRLKKRKRSQKIWSKGTEKMETSLKKLLKKCEFHPRAALKSANFKKKCILPEDCRKRRISLKYCKKREFRQKVWEKCNFDQEQKKTPANLNKASRKKPKKTCILLKSYGGKANFVKASQKMLFPSKGSVKCEFRQRYTGKKQEICQKAAEKHEFRSRIALKNTNFNKGSKKI